MDEQREFEAWALARAHSIMLNEGLQLAMAAQNLDKRRTKLNIYQLRQAIADSLLEVAAGKFPKQRQDALPPAIGA